MERRGGEHHELVIPIPIGHLCGAVGQRTWICNGGSDLETGRCRALSRHGHPCRSQPAEGAGPSDRVDGGRSALRSCACSRSRRCGQGACRRPHRLYGRARPCRAAPGDFEPLRRSLWRRRSAEPHRRDHRLVGRVQPRLPGNVRSWRPRRDRRTRLSGLPQHHGRARARGRRDRAGRRCIPARRASARGACRSAVEGRAFRQPGQSDRRGDSHPTT